MLILEIRKFFRQHRILSFAAVSTLTIGIAASSLSLDILRAASDRGISGIAPGLFATIGGSSPTGPIRPLSWEMISSAQDVVPQIVGCARPVSATVEVNHAERAIHVAAVSPEFFERFGVSLSPGGLRLPTGHRNGSGLRWILLTNETAQSLFGSPEKATGQLLRVNGLPLEVVGLVPSEFKGLLGQRVDAWVPPSCVDPFYLRLPKIAGAGDEGFENAWRKAALFYGLVRVPTLDTAPRITAALQADAHITGRLVAVSGLEIDPGREAGLKHWLGVALLLATALTAASGLGFGAFLLARAPRQTEEVRLKRILGATAPQILFGLCAGPISALMAAFACSFVVDAIVLSLVSDRLDVLGLNAMSFLQSLPGACASQAPLVLFLCLVMAVVPALRLVRDDGTPRAGYTATESRRHRAVIFGLVGCQIFVGTCICVAAGMIAKSAWQFATRPLGFAFDDRAVFRVYIKPGTREFSFKAYSEGSFPLANAASEILGQTTAIPGVAEAALALAAPMEPTSTRSIVLHRLDVVAEDRNVELNAVTKSWFSLAGARFLSGSAFSSAALTGEVEEAVLNRALASQIWPGSNAVGKSIDLSEPSSGLRLTVRIVGVIEDERFNGPGESISPTVILPLRGVLLAQALPFYVLTNSKDADSAACQIVINRILDTEIPGLSVGGWFSVQRRVRDAVLAEIGRSLAVILGSLAILIVALASLYGSIAYSVRNRHRELAIRMACGATPAEIVWTVLRQTLFSAGIALLLSTLFWGPLRKMIDSVGVTVAWSPGLASAITGISFLGAVLTVIRPAIRASRSSIADALRD